MMPSRVGGKTRRRSFEQIRRYASPQKMRPKHRRRDRCYFQESKGVRENLVALLSPRVGGVSICMSENTTRRAEQKNATGLELSRAVGHVLDAPVCRHIPTVKLFDHSLHFCEVRLNDGQRLSSDSNKNSTYADASPRTPVIFQAHLRTVRLRIAELERAVGTFKMDGGGNGSRSSSDPADVEKRLAGLFKEKWALAAAERSVMLHCGAQTRPNAEVTSIVASPCRRNLSRVDPSLSDGTCVLPPLR